MTEGPAPAKIVPTSVNETSSSQVDGTSIVSDVATKAATVVAPVKRAVVKTFGRRR